MHMDDELEDIHELILWDKAKFTFHLLGSTISFLNLVGQILYAAKSLFLSTLHHQSFVAFLILRPILILVLSLYFTC